MNRAELVERLSSCDSSVFFGTPYGKARKISDDDIGAALLELKPSSSLNSVRLLFLLDYSREVKSMSENFGKEITDAEAADRAEKYFEEHIIGQAD